MGKRPFKISKFQDGEAIEQPNHDDVTEQGPAPNGRIYSNFLSPGTIIIETFLPWFEMFNETKKQKFKNGLPTRNRHLKTI